MCLHSNGKTGILTSTDKFKNHKDLILALLDVIQLPAKVAIYKCAAHTKNTDTVSNSNREAEEEAKKKTALQTERQIWQNKSAIYNQTCMNDRKENPYCQKACMLQF